MGVHKIAEGAETWHKDSKEEPPAISAKTLAPFALNKTAEVSVSRSFVYQLQPYDFSAASCCAAACLQAAARVPLVAGFSASFFQEARH